MTRECLRYFVKKIISSVLFSNWLPVTSLILCNFIYFLKGYSLNKKYVDISLVLCYYYYEGIT